MHRARMILAAVLIGVIGFGLTASAQAMTSMKSGNDVVLHAGQTADQTIFYAGNTVDIAGTVNGDVFCAGQTVTVSGTVNGDVICAGQNVTISANVSGDVRVAGQNVTISGQVANNASVLAQAATIDSGGRIARDAQITAQSATINGTVGRDLAGASTSMAVNGTVGRDVLATVASLSLGNSAVVNGSIVYTSASTLSKAGGAQVSGTITRYQPTKATKQNAARAGAGNFWFSLYLLASLLLVALVLVLLFPRLFHLATEVAYRSPWLTLLVGLVTSIVVPAVFVLLLITVIGIPLALLLLLVWILVSVLAWVFAAYYVGSLLLHNSTRNPIWYMLLGAAIIIILSFIPFLGFFVWLVSLWMGVGIIVRQYAHLPRPRYEVERV